jgi:hypothetical protein
MEIIDIEAEVRAKRDEDRAHVAGPSKGHPGGGVYYQRYQKRRWLKNLILKLEEFDKVAFLKRISHIDPY